MDKARLTVTERAETPEASKSDMEKYLAGPRSPRGTAIAAICREFNVSAHRPIFCRADHDFNGKQFLLFQLVNDEIHTLLMELTQGAPFCEKCAQPDPSSSELHPFVHLLSQERAFEVTEQFQMRRGQIDTLIEHIFAPLPSPSAPQAEKKVLNF